jgi:Txe/YoeB family toxin of toxin-antitoxin system
VAEPWRIAFTKQAQKDARNVARNGLQGRANALLETLQSDPFMTPPPYEKLSGDMVGAYSRRINLQHRLVYEIFVEERTVKIISMWNHYE